MKTIGYTYDADYHCPECTQKRFGESLPKAKDREGNPVYHVSSIEELPCDISNDNGGYSPVTCGDCHAIIKERDKHSNPAKDKVVWKRQPFRVAVSAGDAERVGLVESSQCFAIENGTRVVTHIPTGLRINFGSFRFRQAKRYAERLLALDVDWRAVNNDNFYCFTVGGEPLKEIVKAISESILLEGGAK